MSIKWLGAILIIAGCGGFGFLIAYHHKREEQLLRQMLTAADHMSCELQYRLTPLPQLCAQIQEHCKGPVGSFFGELGRELDKQVLPDVSRCMEVVLNRTRDLPQSMRRILHEFGLDLGRFDLNGQLIGLDSVRTSCKANLHRLSENREARLRSYQTLGLCAGAALAILFA